MIATVFSRGTTGGRRALDARGRRRVTIIAFGACRGGRVGPCGGLREAKFVGAAPGIRSFL